MSRQSASINLRDREIREILDEDLKQYKEVLRREFKQARLMGETYSPPNQTEKQIAFQIEKYFVRLQQEADLITNGLVNDQIEDTSGLIAAYQELIGYLEVYAKYGSLGQRDLAVIENKFDAIAPQISQIATAATYLRWRQAPLLEQLDSLLDDRHYIKLRDVSRRTVAEQVVEAEAEELPRRPLPPPRRQDPPPPPDEGGPPPPPSSGFRSVKREPKAEPGTSPASPASPATPKLRKDLQTEIDKIPDAEFNSLLMDLGLYDGLVAKRGSTTKSLKKVANKTQLQLVYQYKTTGVNPTVAVSIASAPPMLEYGDPAAPGYVNTDPSLVDFYFGPGSTYRPEIQPDISGDGRRKTHGIMCGAGEAEDMMFGQPAGVKKAMHLRPIDKKLVHYKTPDKVGEAGLTLEKRMLFLNQLDSKCVKDDMEINCTHTYKKAMSDKAKHMEKMKK